MCIAWKKTKRQPYQKTVKKAKPGTAKEPKCKKNFEKLRKSKSKSTIDL